MAKQLPDSRLVIANTGVHAVHLDYSTCVRRIVDRFFLKDELAPTFSRCSA
ncbi:MAG: alpha/beta hydrolase [Actinomycetota bacterium]